MNKVELVGARSAAAMRVVERGVYRGPHLFSHIPMVRIQIDLGGLEAWPSNRLPGFTDQLVQLMPALQEHGCSYHEAGGFVRRLHEGTWLGHVAEHVALELQSMAGSAVTRGKTRSVDGKPGVYNVMFAYKEEDVGLLAGRLALQLVNSLLPPELQGIEGLDRVYRDLDEPALAEPFDIELAIKALKRLLRRTTLGPTTRALVQEAMRRGIPVMRLDDQSLVQLGYGSRQRRIRASITSLSSHIAVETASDKDLTKTLLRSAGVPVPEGAVVRSAEGAVKEAERLGYPVVIKPLDGNHGRGVTMGVKDEAQVRWAFEQATKHSRRVLVEQQFEGHDHRILVVDGEVVAVAERVPAQVVGDGRRSIRELVDEVNLDPRRGDGHEQVMTRIVIDNHVVELLARSGLTPESVPGKGKRVYLRATANLSTGGTAVDRTDDIHPDNALLARRAARAIGLDVAGIDFIAPDISKSVRETGGGVIEVNAAPGFRMHLEPSEGRPRNVAKPVLRMLYPEPAPSCIPILAITGTNGKSTTTRMVAHVLRQTGLTVGMTTTSGVYINDDRIAKGDATGPRSARMVLQDPTVDVAVLETARGGLLREGLAFDSCDVGAVLNVQPDHLGLKGINTVEDLAWVKSIVVEAVRRGGFSVLNADDPHTIRMQRRAGGRTVFFSLRGGGDMPGFLHRHVAEGGIAVVREPGEDGGLIVIHDGEERIPVIRADEIPATLEGLAEFNIANALAAVAVSFAHGVGAPAIRSALSTFTSSFEQTPGRLNVFDGHGFRVILDYAHNPTGLAALRDLVQKMRPQHHRAIGLIAIPGDRRDEDIRAMGEIASGCFDELMFREDPGTRGRNPGEVMRMMAEGALTAGMPAEHVHTVRHERDAVEICLRNARTADLVVLVVTEVDEVWRQILDFRPGRSEFRSGAPVEEASWSAAP